MMAEGKVKGSPKSLEHPLDTMNVYTKKHRHFHAERTLLSIAK